MYDSLVFYTFIALILFFSCLEFYKIKLRKIGHIVEVCPSDGLEHFLRSRFRVKLKDGQIVEAEAERCTMCIGQFKIGDEVKLIQSKNNRYVIHLPVISLKSNTCKTARPVTREM